MRETPSTPGCGGERTLSLAKGFRCEVTCAEPGRGMATPECLVACVTVAGFAPEEGIRADMGRARVEAKRFCVALASKAAREVVEK